MVSTDITTGLRKGAVPKGCPHSGGKGEVHADRYRQWGGSKWTIFADFPCGPAKKKLVKHYART
jgi:hypothetical protein